MITTCQICARVIKLVRGRIAHHGYRRPWGAGSQTSSCDGTRHLSYEVACDALPPAIDAVASYMVARETARAVWLANPPRGITVPSQPGRDYVPPNRSVIRPAGFDPRDTAGVFVHRNSYAYLYHSTLRGIDGDIRAAGYELDRLRKRLAGWRPAPGAVRSAAHPEQTDV